MDKKEYDSQFRYVDLLAYYGLEKEFCYFYENTRGIKFISYACKLFLDKVKDLKKIDFSITFPITNYKDLEDLYYTCKAKEALAEEARIKELIEIAKVKWLDED